MWSLDRAAEREEDNFEYDEYDDESGDPTLGSYMLVGPKQ